MKLLLDTHIWIWYLIGSERLSDTLRITIADETTELWLSPISVWETLILAEKGRLSLNPSPVEWINNSLQVLKISEAPPLFHHHSSLCGVGQTDRDLT